MKKVSLFILLAIGISIFAQAQVKEKVAVYVSGEVSNNYKKIISFKAVS